MSETFEELAAIGVGCLAVAITLALPILAVIALLKYIL